LAMGLAGLRLSFRPESLQRAWVVLCASGCSRPILRPFFPATWSHRRSALWGRGL